MNETSRAAPETVERWLSEYARTPSAALRDRIVEAHLYIAGLIARKFSGRGVDYDDLYQVAALALVKALDRYDPGHGIRFVSFVTPSMVGEVRNYFRDKAHSVRPPRRGMALRRAVDAATEVLAQRLSRMPRIDELAAEVGASEDAVLEALEIAVPVSLDAAPAGEEDASPLDAFLGAEERGYGRFEDSDALRRALDALEERQRTIVRLRYYENLSQREVAQRLNVSQMTVSREERKALLRLREQGVLGD